MQKSVVRRGYCSIEAVPQMNKVLPLCALIVGWAAFAPANLYALRMTPPPRANSQPAQFVFKDSAGNTSSVDVVRKYQPDKIVRPFARFDRQIDPKLMRAATIAEERAHAHSRRQCWHAVKEALVASGVVDSRPKTALAKQAAQELVSNYGFKRLPVSDPYQAPGRFGACLQREPRGRPR